MLFGKSKEKKFDRDGLLERLAALKKKCHRLEKKFASKSELEDSVANDRLALSCRRSADTLEECAELVSQMLPPRGKQKAKDFESKFRELLRRAEETLIECESFDYPVSNGSLEAAVNDLKALVLDITAI